MKSKKRKICIITGTRAEWGLLRNLAQEISNDTSLELQIIATGMHLSTEFGLTYKEIEQDFTINKKIEIILSADTPTAISKTMGLAQILISEAYAELHPDIIVVLGDRYEIFACVASAMIARIPIAHIHGGEATEGLIDEAIRHCITKMSHFHFAATNEYAKRIIQLGEQPQYVFNVGGFGIDAIQNINFLSKQNLEKELNFTFRTNNFLVTFHPVTLETMTSQRQFQELLNALQKIQNQYDIGIIFTKANSDTDGRIINSMIDDFVAQHQDNTIAFTSMGQLRYLSSMNFIDAVVGNSSSGLGEAPSFKIGTINIGDRQKGRIKATSVIDCDPTEDSILQAFSTLFSKDFQHKLPSTINPYGNGGASHKTKEILKNINLEGVLKKPFYNLDN